MNPWVFGDEYLYLSKARNIARGLDVLADVNVGHTYPPLYSYLISLVIGNDPDQTYRLIQLLNLGVGQLMILASLYFLNRVFKWSQTIMGKLFLVLLYLVLATNTMFTGFYFSAMSENLYSPLILLIFALFVWVIDLHQVASGRLDRNQILAYLALGILTGLAVLTRTIGVVLLPTMIIALAIQAIQEAKFGRSYLLGAVIILIGSVSTIFLFNAWETSRIVNTQLEQASYEELSTAYRQVVVEAITGKINLFWSFKILGNHLAYFVWGTFFFPLLFILHRIVESIKARRANPAMIFVLLFAAGSVIISFLHCYHGFYNNPIRYSTYFRYVDQAVILFGLYGLIEAWQWFKSKEKLSLLTRLTWLGICLISIVFLPSRDFYITLNSFGWAWLDIFQSYQWSIRVVAGILALLTLFIVKQKRLLFFLLGGIILLQTLSLPVIKRMHLWLGSGFVEINQPIREVAVEKGITDFYIAPDFMDKGLLGELYYIKYLLLFYSDNFTPVEILDPETDLAALPRPYGYLDMPGSYATQSANFNEEIKVNDKVSVYLMSD